MAGGLCYALDPREGDNLAERFGPLLVVVAWVAVSVAALFGVVPLEGPAATVYAGLSGAAAYWLRGQAVPPAPPPPPAAVDPRLGSSRRRQR